MSALWGESRCPSSVLFAPPIGHDSDVILRGLYSFIFSSPLEYYYYRYRSSRYAGLFKRHSSRCDDDMVGSSKQTLYHQASRSFGAVQMSNHQSG